MMMNPRYSIGIDLGTTNCAMAFVDLSEGGESESVLIPQRERERTEVERTNLPSFLFWNEDGMWEAGLFARERGRELPDRVVHSAKSWLCHHSVSPEAKTLPWKSKAIGDASKLSPIEASSRLLQVLKSVWNSRFGAVAPFVEQVVTVTVPASFDAAAQAATLEAARLAGYPNSLRLLEEPQAAFYRWLESADAAANELKEGDRILVVDIGGGTSDFSLFEVGSGKNDRPSIKRVSVSEHLLLGGDNIDLALSHALESELAPEGEELSVDQWGYLLSRARELKERCLSESVEEENQISVSLPSKGAGLFAGTLATEVSSRQVRELVLEGFFPDCPIGARPERSAEGLLEIGLPYATDCAVTRHLAEFLNGDARVDRVLFNGGSLSPNLIQERLVDQLGNWSKLTRPAVLPNVETDLAVSRGAAFYGATLHGNRQRISAGAARAVFLEVATDAEERRICVLPKGAEPGEVFEVNIDGLSLAVNQRSRFRAFQGTDGMTQRPGEWCDEGRDAMRQLPTLDASVDAQGEHSIPVRLISGVNEVGLLTVHCESIENPFVRWPLAFNLRSNASSASSPASGELEVAPPKVRKAKKLLNSGLCSRGSGVKASRIFRDAEVALGLKKHEWSLDLCRTLLSTPLEMPEWADRNAESAEAGLQLTGFLLRPGFGAVGDEERLLRLEEILEALGPKPVKVEVQQMVLLRRVAGGLSAEKQAELFDREFDRLLKTKRAEAERLRMLASLEKLELGRKQQLLGELRKRLEKQLASDGPVAVLLAALGTLLSRVLLGAGLEKIVPPESVEELFDRLKKLDWREAHFSEASSLFLKAARVVEDRSLNLPRRSAAKIVSKLEKSGVPEKRLRPLRELVPVSRKERASSFGESLPPGLLLQV